MAAHNELGKKGEQIAVDFLLEKGYKILATNFVFNKAEIDIIAKKKEILVAVEVKTRSSLAFGLPQEAVKPKKIQLLVKAMNEYVIQQDIDAEIRFDIISIFKNNTRFEVEHIEDAFYFF